jgi:hypothetical protein
MRRGVGGWVFQQPAERGARVRARPDVFNDVTGEIFHYGLVWNPGHGLAQAQKNKNLRNVPGVTAKHEINP